MKKLCKIISLLFGTAMLHGCAGTLSESRNLTIEPFQTIRHATNRPDGYYHLGRHYQSQNRFDLAVKAYQKALAIDPNFSEAHNALGTIYAAQGRFDQALAEFNTVIAKAPNAAHLYNNLGYLSILQGKDAEAIAAFTKAITLDPTNKKALNNLGMLLAKTGEPKEPNQAIASTTEQNTSVPSRDNHDLNHVEPGSEGFKISPTLTLPKDHGGIIAYTPTSKPDSNIVEHLDSDHMKEEAKAIHSDLAQSTFQPPFAVLATPNPKAMPVVVISGSPLPTSDKAIKTQTKILVEKPSTDTASTLKPNSAANVMADKKTKSAIQLSMSSPKAFEFKKVSSNAAPVYTIKDTPTSENRSFKLEVSNGNGIRHMAARINSMLSAKGLPKARLTNQKPFTQARTEIQYRKGYLLEATRLNNQLKDVQHVAFLVESKDLSPSSNIRLVLGKDLSKQTWPSNVKAITLASR